MSSDDIEKSVILDAKGWRPRPPLRRRRRALALQLLMILIGLCICYDFLIGPVNLPSPHKASDGEIRVQSSPLTEKLDFVEETESSTDPVLTRLEPTEQELQPKDPVVVPDDLLHKKPTAQTTDSVPLPKNDLSMSLDRMIALLPDEMRIQSLLRPLEATGGERLRDLGLRTRDFWALYEAWETVHLVPTDDGLYIRDDIIQYLRRHPELAESMVRNTTDIIRSYESYRSLITRLSTLLFPWTAPHFPDHIHLHTQIHSGGRGLVFSAGDNQAPFLFASIPAIRQLGCDLPIEVMYLGDQDLSQDMREQLEALPGVTTRDLSQMVDDNGWKLAGWAGKPFAILFSSFREAIFIDADSLFLQNPEILFEDEAYRKTGALFFKDRLMMPESKKRWLQEILPRPVSNKAMGSRFWTGQSGHMQESGVVVVDKWRHFIALLLVTRMNGPDRDGDQSKQKTGVYDMVYGDKETFWLGWELIGDLDYAFHDGDAGVMGTLEKASTENGQAVQAELAKTNATDEAATTVPEMYTICAPQLLHLDRSGRPLWFNGWLLPNKFDKGKNQEPSRFEAFLEEPREIRDPGAWQLRANNICCLTSEHKGEFSRDERQVLDMIIELGRRAGVLGTKGLTH
ncbi:alpha-1,3-mannosyltransferase MNT2 [Aspergillus udagawae]|uniref:Alpha-1,3-mannosyltransferase MNT2 n=1 Tax=Aspergillus udagawae TaxID=91492 RepID=A0ABQ1AAP5_9EURO|nr:alpha-1,3-mannosyltransferase MNT2 [Aspergillus udagawae]GFG08898.1 alpha-1,3-mannosyltransferase MNT2 [Aspergillus udagawae]